MTATTVLMPTVAPSGTLISLRMPVSGEGISRLPCRWRSRRGLVFFDAVAGLLEAICNGALHDRLAHLGHDYVGGMSPSLYDSKRVYERFLPDYKSLRCGNRWECWV